MIFYVQFSINDFINKTLVIFLLLSSTYRKEQTLTSDQRNEQQYSVWASTNRKPRLTAAEIKSQTHFSFLCVLQSDHVSRSDGRSSWLVSGCRGSVCCGSGCRGSVCRGSGCRGSVCRLVCCVRAAAACLYVMSQTVVQQPSVWSSFKFRLILQSSGCRWAELLSWPLWHSQSLRMTHWLHRLWSFSLSVQHEQSQTDMNNNSNNHDELDGFVLWNRKLATGSRQMDDLHWARFCSRFLFQVLLIRTCLRSMNRGVWFGPASEEFCC